MLSRLQELLNENHGYVRTKDLPQYGLARKQLATFVKEGTLYMVKRGLYKSTSTETEPFESFTDVAQAIPQGVICLESALNYYELSTTNPGLVHVAVENKTRVTLPEYPPVRLHFFAKKQYESGITEVSHPRGAFRIFAAEKTICDCLRQRSLVGNDLAMEALKDYLQRKDRNLEALMYYGRLGRVEKLLKNYLEAML